MQTMKLTDADRKVIAAQKRAGYVFSGLFLAFAALGNLAYGLMAAEKSAVLLVVVNLVLVVAGFSIALTVNRKYNRDARDGEKEITTAGIQCKVTATDYEPGSGSLYIPILGDLFPKLWGQEMKRLQRYSLVVDGIGHSVDKMLFDRVAEGDEIEIHRAKYSRTVLQIRKK